MIVRYDVFDVKFLFPAQVFDEMISWRLFFKNDAILCRCWVNRPKVDFTQNNQYTPPY